MVRVRQPGEDIEQNRPQISRLRAPTDRQGGPGHHVDVLELQRLAGNQAVSDLLGSGGLDLQRADAGTTATTATDAGTTTDSASDAEIDGLDLQSDVADAARALKKKIPAVHFTSGRRTLEEDSSAVAGNIVANRNYVDIFVNSRPKRLIKKWVDDHPTATRQEITDALVAILEPMNETERSYWSLHLAGRAFDISQSSCSLADLQKAFPQALQEETHWHVQFVGTWSKP
jgi:hypothetical protein